jgi:DNA-binding Xre family transcriptional regulator
MKLRPLRELAKKVGIENASQLRTATGLGVGTCYQLWDGTATRFDLETLNTVCNALQVGPAYLFDYTPDVEQQGEPGQGGQATKPERRGPVKVKRKTKHTSPLRIVAAAG